jgi:hypothetical protein
MRDDPFGHETETGHPLDNPGRGIALVDFDGTLADYHGWQGDYQVGKPLPSAERLLRGLYDLQYEVYIFTARIPDVVRTWLAIYELDKYVVDVTNTKLPGHRIIVDDCAIRMTGPDTVGAILVWAENPRCWWEPIPGGTKPNPLVLKPRSETRNRLHVEAQPFVHETRDPASGYWPERFTPPDLASNIRFVSGGDAADDVDPDADFVYPDPEK